MALALLRCSERGLQVASSSLEEQRTWPRDRNVQSALKGHREVMESVDGSVTYHPKASRDRRIKEWQLQKFRQEAWKKQNTNVTWLEEEKQVSCWSIC